MSFVPIMWTVWSVLVLLAIALYLYRSRLTRDEDDQIFLDDSFDQMKAEQTSIATKVGKVEPLVKISLWLVAAGTVFVIGYYIWDVVNQFK
jgi:hypothetical protein